MTNETKYTDGTPVIVSPLDGMIILEAPPILLSEVSHHGGVAVVDDKILYRQYEELQVEELILMGRCLENQRMQMELLGISKTAE